MKEEVLKTHESSLVEESMYVSLAPQVAALLAQVSIWRHHFEGEHGLRVWTVSSTARGGGVAEMMGRLVSGLGGFGVPARWLIMDAEAEFFTITKRLHNAIHGHVTCSGDSDGDGDSIELLSDADRALFNRVGEREADELVDNFMLPAGFDPSRDLILCHDPQTLAMMPQLRARLPGAKIAWRCHVGLDSPAPCVAAVWAVLEPLAAIADACIFSSPSYVRERLRSRSCIMRPGLSPLSPKNRECSPAEVISLLWRGGLLRHLTSPRCALYKAFEAKAVCYGADAAAASGEQVLPPAIGAVRTAAGAGEPIVTAACGCTCAGGICVAPSSTACLLRPIVLQVSRWDALKGWSSLLAAWAQIKSGAWPAPAGASAAARVRYDHYIESAVLVLAGPEPASIADDPEGREVLARLQREYDALPESVRKDVVLALLPMANAAENALIVNALQRSAAVIVQNSLEEGFGLTCTEALFKRICVIGTQQAVGLREQIRDGVDGILVAGDPAQPANVARALRKALFDPRLRAFLAVNGQRRVFTAGYLDHNQLGEYISLAARLFGWRAARVALAPELVSFVKAAEFEPMAGGGEAPPGTASEEDESQPAMMAAAGGGSESEGGPDAEDVSAARVAGYSGLPPAATLDDDDVAPRSTAVSAVDIHPHRSASFRVLLTRLATDHNERARRSRVAS